MAWVGWASPLRCDPGSLDSFQPCSVHLRPLPLLALLPPLPQ